MPNSKSVTPTTPSHATRSDQSGCDVIADAAATVRKHPVAKIETGNNSKDEDALVGRSKAELIAAEALVELSKVERVFKREALHGGEVG
ncbi:MAG: hypothetical protein Q9176_007700 [Flavoplaca citrina]